MAIILCLALTPAAAILWLQLPCCFRIPKVPADSKRLGIPVSHCTTLSGTRHCIGPADLHRLVSLLFCGTASSNWASGEDDHVVGRAEYDFNAVSEEEISFHAGEMLRLAPKGKAVLNYCTFPPNISVVL